MAYHNNFFIFILAVLNVNLVKCTEFVPVYMWGSNNKLSEHVPALHKISQDSFKDTLLEYLKGDPYIIVFAEHNLSPEDFAQRDQNGKTAFKNVHQLKEDNVHVTYRPYVQNPIGAVKQLNKPVTEISIGSLLTSTKEPKDILVIDLNDAKEDETRFHMLQRHDSDIVSIYKALLEEHENVVAIYTAHHTAWVAPEDFSHSRSRNLLADEETQQDEGSPQQWSDEKTNVLVYLTDPGSYKSRTKGGNITTDDFTLATESVNETTLVATLQGSDVKITINLLNATGYWYIKSVLLDDVIVTKSAEMYAPLGFSYHCASSNFTVENGSLHLPGFQIQAFKFTSNATLIFGDAYDCVGFTSVPIWSGLFVTAILLLIVTIGLTMMMDIKTMDRFDDPKGKTITITASE